MCCFCLDNLTEGVPLTLSLYLSAPPTPASASWMSFPKKQKNQQLYVEDDAVSTIPTDLLWTLM